MKRYLKDILKQNACKFYLQRKYKIIEDQLSKILYLYLFICSSLDFVLEVDKNIHIDEIKSHFSQNQYKKLISKSIKSDVF